MNSTMSGWSIFRTTILAARRVVPPDLIAPAEASAPRINETGPEAVPPSDRRSREERKTDKLIPDPEPCLKIIPSFLIQSRMDSMESSMARIKQAEHCGCSRTPTLNQTGELKAAFWVTSKCVNSTLK